MTQHAAILLASLTASAQVPPLPPSSADGGASVPPTAFQSGCTWDAVDASATGLFLSVSNAATNYTVSLAPTTRTNGVAASFGANRITLTASNAAGTATARTNWNVWLQPQVRLLSSTNARGPFTNAVPPEMATGWVNADAPQMFLALEKRQKTNAEGF